MKYKLGELVDVLSGYAFKKDDYSSEGASVIKIKNIVPPYIDITDSDKISYKDIDKYSKWKTEYNDILISMTGSNVSQMGSAVGKVGRVKNEAPLLINQRVGKFVVKDMTLLDYDFLYYWISRYEIQYRLALEASGSANQANISPRQIKGLEIDLPPLIVQKKIAIILNSLDSKIELNNQIISNLEEQASTLFKRWFVDFDFPDENGNPYKSNNGKMSDSELGEIPKGWKVTKINNVYDIKYGKQMPISELHDTGYPVHGANGSIIGYTDSYMYNKEVALVTCRGNGSGDVFRSLRNSFVTNNLLIFEPLDGIYNVDYTRFLLINNNTYNYQTGSAQPQITIKNISKMKIIVPNIDTLKLFNNKIESIMNQQILMSENNSVLTSIRDSLLPKLLSGEIELPEDEEM